MTDNELLLAISEMMDRKIGSVKNDIRDIKLTMENDIRDIKLTMENDILPRLQNIESCYTTTYKRYQSGVNQIDAIQGDIDIIKKVVTEHSEKLQKIS